MQKIIGIIGAGYSGTALLATLARLSKSPIHIILFEKTGVFGLGHAYRTPYPYHLLNVSAKDMSAFHDEPKHFVDWLNTQGYSYDENQFVSRAVYGQYLQALLSTISSSRVTVEYVTGEVVDAECHGDEVALILQSGQHYPVNKVILALGNNPPSRFPFPVSPRLKTIENPWDYHAIESIASHESVLIVGSGLSMIDAVLSLHQQKHQGKIYALSRHGLLPLPHKTIHNNSTVELNEWPKGLAPLTKAVRAQSQKHARNKGDWREVMHSLRYQAESLWRASSVADKKRFLRHVAAYWNIHRHRVPEEVAALLATLQTQGQLEIVAGRVLAAEDNHIKIKKRHHHELLSLPIQWLINCMGPTLTMEGERQPLVKSLLEKGYVTLDPLRLGFATYSEGVIRDATEKPSAFFYTLGPPCKGMAWESTAVPDIRKQIWELAKSLV